MKIITPAFLLAIVLGLTACGSTPGSSPARSAHRHATSATVVKCGMLTCSHGKVGQPCSIAGYPGIIVQSSATQLACDPAPSTLMTTAPAPAATAPGAPSPVSTEATVSSTCAPGVTDTTTGQFSPVSSTSVLPSEDTPEGAYQVTLTNTSSVTADVTGFAVVFYDGSGTETGSTSNYVSEFITPGQSLTFTENDWTNLSSAPFAAGSNGAVDAAATCQLVQWYHA